LCLPALEILLVASVISLLLELFITFWSVAIAYVIIMMAIVQMRAQLTVIKITVGFQT
jgi:uncharacterized membrane protein